mgnify:CR=1 FL=1
MEVVVIAEGQTEELFIKRVVAPALRGLKVYVKPILLNTSADARGGAVSFDRFMFNARNLLAANPDQVLSCFLDLYKLDTAFPDFAAAIALPNLTARVSRLNVALHSAVVQRYHIRPERFIAHVQPHEFEGLLFADVAALVRIERDWAGNQGTLAAIRGSVPTPEHINDGYETKPSRRLETLLKPAYKKTRHGPLAAQEIGLPAIERECPHFKGWLDKLRSLGLKNL